MEPQEYRAALADALVREIKFEMIRKGIPSNRALAERSGMKHSAVNDRLSKSTRTGRRTAITIPDLFMLAAGLEVAPMELLQRAMTLVDDEADDENRGGSRGRSG